MRKSRYTKGVLTLVLTGGHDEDLLPLTKNRAKPTVPFAGQYRVIDFTLSNCLNSGLRQIYCSGSEFPLHSIGVKTTQMRKFALIRAIRG